MSVPLLSITRNHVVERTERGHAVLADASGAIVWSIGDPHHITYMRSSAKPLQATAMLLSGAMDRFGLQDANLAVACGSHRGEPRHVQTVLSTLSLAGVGPEELACGTHELRPAEGCRLAAAGLMPTPLHNNCSGKHAGMLAAAAAMGASSATYLCDDHPVQQQILQVIAECSGLPAIQIGQGVDGCSAPNFALPMCEIARCFATMADPSLLSRPLAAALSRAGSAMRRDPWLVAGTGEFDSVLMQSMPETLVAKGGAEGLRCVAMLGLGLGLAVKFESGRADGIPAVVLAILTALGVFPAGLPASLADLALPPILNHRQTIVGQTILHLDQPLAELASLKLSH